MDPVFRNPKTRLNVVMSAILKKEAADF